MDTSLEGWPPLPDKLTQPIKLAQEFQLRDKRLTEVVQKIPLVTLHIGRGYTANMPSPFVERNKGDCLISN